MAKNGGLTVEADKFGIALTKLVKDSFDIIDDGLDDVVKATCQKGRRDCQKYASTMPNGPYAPTDKEGKNTWARYLSGFRSTTKKKANGVVGEIGQVNVPGLVHLMEKGHNIVRNGVVYGRTREFKHMAKAAEEAFKYMEKKINELIGKAL